MFASAPSLCYCRLNGHGEDVRRTVDYFCTPERNDESLTLLDCQQGALARTRIGSPSLVVTPKDHHRHVLAVEHVPRLVGRAVGDEQLAPDDLEGPDRLLD